MKEPNDQQAQDLGQIVRADVWLWAVRLFKTRAQSAEACRNGQIRINGQSAKPARQVRVGDILEFERAPLVKTVEVRALLSRRVGAKVVADFMKDLTTEETYARAAEASKAARDSRGPTRAAGTGRPTKKDRRNLEEVMTEAENQSSFYRKLNRKLRRSSSIILALFFVWAQTLRAEDPPRRNFTAAEGAPTFKVSENLSITAKNLAPETDKETGAFKGISASGRVLIKFRPQGKEDWILVSCGKATYDPGKDEIILTRFPSVKAKGQVLRATAEETYVRIARSSGKWEIDGPHKMELNLQEFKK